MGCQSSRCGALPGRLCGGFATLLARFEAAARLCGAADALREAIGSALNPSDTLRRDRRLAPARAGLGEAGFAALQLAGREMGLEESVAFALEATKYECSPVIGCKGRFF